MKLQVDTFQAAVVVLVAETARMLWVLEEIVQAEMEHLDKELEELGI